MQQWSADRREGVRGARRIAGKHRERIVNNKQDQESYRKALRSQFRSDICFEKNRGDVSRGWCWAGALTDMQMNIDLEQSGKENEQCCCSSITKGEQRSECILRLSGFSHVKHRLAAGPGNDDPKARCGELPTMCLKRR